MKKSEVLGTNDKASERMSTMQDDRMLSGIGFIGLLQTTTNTNETTCIHKWMKGNQRT
jgi:hypothetical protein